MGRKNTLFLVMIIVFLVSEVFSLFFMKPHYFTFNTVLSIFFLFLSGLILFDFTYKRYMRTMLGVISYGFTSVVSLVLSEAITLMYASYLYPNSFNNNSYSNITALADALTIISGYGYPRVNGVARGVIILLMLYSWLVNVLLITKLISIFIRKLT